MAELEPLEPEDLGEEIEYPEPLDDEEEPIEIDEEEETVDFDTDEEDSEV